ncbi:MAG: hypothetical protein HZY78_01730 [Burkholderiaceae bacterium]|nr:MAG: hypothetical protein HZY78_01730 [Burkholderiaceae bacterium]
MPARRPHLSQARRQQSGIALIISLILLVVMTMFGLLVVRNISNEERLSGYVYDRALALQGAEAALRRAENLVETIKPQPTSGCSDFTSSPNTVHVCAPRRRRTRRVGSTAPSPTGPRPRPSFPAR